MDHASEKPTWQVSTKLRVRSRTLRRNLTEAERIIWYAVRAHRLNGASFRRQTPIGPFIVDFVCRDARLIIGVPTAPGRPTDSIEGEGVLRTTLGVPRRS